MTPSQPIGACACAKSYGCESIVWLSSQADVKVRTLFDWYHTHPKRFKAICLGAVQLREEDD